MTAILLPIGFALLAAVQAWDYGVPYYPAPHYFEHQQPYDFPCPPSGPESLVCAGAPGAQPSTFPSPCEVQRFRALTGINWEIIHENRCETFEVCPDNCQDQYSPVCGKYKDTRRNYRSECELQLVKCRTGHPWRKQHDGPCESRYPVAQSPRAQNYNPYAINPYQPNYGSSGSYASYGPIAPQGPYRSQGPDGSQGPYGSHRSAGPYGPYGPYGSQSQPQGYPQSSFVSPKPTYEAPVYQPYEISWENIPTESEYSTTSKPYTNSIYEEAPTASPTSTSTTTTSPSTTSTTTTSTTTTSTTSTTEQEDTTEAPSVTSNPRQNIKVNAVIEGPANKTTQKPSTTAAPTEAPTTVETQTELLTETSSTESSVTAPPLKKYATTAPPQHATTTAKPLKPSISINAVKDSKQEAEETTEQQTSTESSTLKAKPTYVSKPPYQSLNIYKASTVYSTTESPKDEGTTQETLDKLIKINAVEVSTEKKPEETTEAPTTSASSTPKAAPTYPSYPSYPSSSVYKTHPVYGTTQAPEDKDTTQESLDKVFKINAVEVSTEKKPEETTEAKTTSESSTPKAAPTYPSYPSYPSSSVYKTYTVYGTTQAPEDKDTTQESLDKVFKINAVEVSTEKKPEETTEAKTTSKSSTPKAAPTYPSYPTYPSSSIYKTNPVYGTTKAPKDEDTTQEPLDKVFKINAVEVSTEKKPEETTEAKTSSKSSTPKAAPTYPSYPTYPSSSIYKTNPVYGTTEAPKDEDTTQEPLDKVFKINAVEVSTEKKPEETTEAKTTSESSTPKAAPTYPSYPTYPSSSVYETYPVYGSTETPRNEESEDDKTTERSLDKAIKINAVLDSHNKTSPEPSQNSTSAPTVSGNTTSAIFPEVEQGLTKDTQNVANSTETESGEIPEIVRTESVSKNGTVVNLEVTCKRESKKLRLDTSSSDNRSNLYFIFLGC